MNSSSVVASEVSNPHTLVVGVDLAHLLFGLGNATLPWDKTFLTVLEHLCYNVFTMGKATKRQPAASRLIDISLIVASIPGSFLKNSQNESASF